MIPTEHLIVGGASSAAIALIGSVFNAVRFPSTFLTLEKLADTTFLTDYPQLVGPLRRQETPKQPNNTSRHLPLRLKLDLHFLGSSFKRTGNAKTHVSPGTVFISPSKLA